MKSVSATAVARAQKCVRKPLRNAARSFNPRFDSIFAASGTPGLTLQGVSLWPLALAAALMAGCSGEPPGSNAPLASAQVAPAVAADATGLVNPAAKFPDHHEFDAALYVPFRTAQGGAGRELVVSLNYPGMPAGQVFAWQVALVDERQQVLRTLGGEAVWGGRPLTVTQAWDGRDAQGQVLPEGRYEARLSAVTLPGSAAEAAPASGEARRSALWARAEGHEVQQRWSFQVGRPAGPQMPAFAPLRTALDANGPQRARPLSVPATGSLPYTVYYANLHSQTNDSDGGGAISSCTSSQAAQTGAYGPADAFAYGKAAGLDALMTSEHNHYFDGSSSTNAAGSATAARSRYQAGLGAASSFNSANPGFLAIYGMEWGVISNGGHLNIFNSSELFSWEYNSSNELFGDRYVAKSDYAALYGAMRAQGLIGQFNHPETSGQFAINGTDLAYSADGDEVMVLAEVLNTSAFSSNTTETETGRSSYEDAFNKLLERGYHVAPATNQDNHCANWGKSYTNRTGVLIPTGTALGRTAFLEALKARRVFASMDKNSQLVLQANGHLMGERFSNSGPLNLTVGFANSAGRSVATVQIIEGVPKRNGTVSTLASTATATVTPAVGEHFYYAKVTQDDGKILWSAPIWVTQTSGGGTADTTPPTASASVSGTAGSITLAATASDNVGVSRVDFVVDGNVVGSDSSAPYSLALDSTTLSNGSHTLVARAYDAAGNVGASSSVSFSVSNASAVLNETESNGTIASANVVSGQTTISGTMSSSSDKDFFKVSLAAGRKLRVDMVGPSTTDYDLYLVNGSGTTLVASEGSTSSESLTYTNGSSAQTVYLKVISYSGSSTTQRYTLTLSYP